MPYVTLCNGSKHDILNVNLGLWGSYWGDHEFMFRFSNFEIIWLSKAIGLLNPYVLCPGEFFGSPPYSLTNKFYPRAGCCFHKWLLQKISRVLLISSVAHVPDGQPIRHTKPDLTSEELCPGRYHQSWLEYEIWTKYVTSLTCRLSTAN